MPPEDNDQSPTIREILSEKHLKLPGSDWAKTGIYLLFVVLLLVLTVNNPVFSDHETSISPYCNWSFALLLLCMIFAVFSQRSVDLVLNSRVNEINHYICLYWGKILVEISVAFFFLVVCGWVILLGGIMRSPFATLLSVSPVLLFIQIWYNRTFNYNEIREALRVHWKGDDLEKSHRRAKTVVRIMGIIPIVLVMATLIIGQICIAQYNIHITLLGAGFDKVVASNWYSQVYYVTYYLSVLTATFGILPPHMTRRIGEQTTAFVIGLVRKIMRVVSRVFRTFD